MNTVDLLSYGGLVGAVVAILQGLKGAVPSLVSGRERFFVLILSVVLGVVAKTVVHGFPGVDWGSFVVMLFVLVVPNANIAHDVIVNPLMGKKGPGSEAAGPSA